MTLALHDTPTTTPDAATAAPVVVLAPRHYQERAIAVFEDAELLLSAILPDARVEHVGASAIPGAYSKGDVDLCVAAPQDGFHEALGVLGEAGFSIRAGTLRTEQLCVLDAPASDVALSVRLVDAGSGRDAFTTFRDALRADPTLLARYNAVRIEAAPRGAAAYASAKDDFIRGVLAAQG